MRYSQFKKLAKNFTPEQLRCDTPPSADLLKLIGSFPSPAFYEAYVNRYLAQEHGFRDHGKAIGVHCCEATFPTAKDADEHERSHKRLTTHPFVATPNNGPCSSCGKRRSAPIHRWR